MQASRVTVGTSATLVVDTGNSSPQSCLVRVPTGGASVFFGGQGVTAATGYEVPAGDSLALDLLGDNIYGIVAAGTQVVHVLKRM